MLWLSQSPWALGSLPPSSTASFPVWEAGGRVAGGALSHGPAWKGQHVLTELQLAHSFPLSFSGLIPGLSLALPAPWPQCTSLPTSVDTWMGPVTVGASDTPTSGSILNSVPPTSASAAQPYLITGSSPARTACLRAEVPSVRRPPSFPRRGALGAEGWAGAARPRPLGSRPRFGAVLPRGQVLARVLTVHGALSCPNIPGGGSWPRGG